MTGPDAFDHRTVLSPLDFFNPFKTAVEVGLGVRAFAVEVATLRFSQVTASPFFSAQGIFGGESIADVAAQLRAGTLAASDVPVQVVTMDGTTLIVNTRSALSLMQGGVQQSEWALIDMTGNASVEAQIGQRLLNNGLTTNGTSVLRITGSGPNASTLIPGP